MAPYANRYDDTAQCAEPGFFTWTTHASPLAPAVRAPNSTKGACRRTLVGLAAIPMAGGLNLAPYIAVISDVTHHVDVLPGNDTLRGGAGNDTVVGDNAIYFAPLMTGMPDLDKVIADLNSQLVAVAQDRAREQHIHVRFLSDAPGIRLAFRQARRQQAGTHGERAQRRQ